jgi:hypothetical protein
VSTLTRERATDGPRLVSVAPAARRSAFMGNMTDHGVGPERDATDRSRRVRSDGRAELRPGRQAPCAVPTVRSRGTNVQAALRDLVLSAAAEAGGGLRSSTLKRVDDWIWAEGLWARVGRRRSRPARSTARSTASPACTKTSRLSPNIRSSLRARDTARSDVRDAMALHVRLRAHDEPGRRQQRASAPRLLSRDGGETHAAYRDVWLPHQQSTATGNHAALAL